MAITRIFEAKPHLLNARYLAVGHVRAFPFRHGTLPGKSAVVPEMAGSIELVASSERYMNMATQRVRGMRAE